MREMFVFKKFGADSLKIIETANQIVEEYINLGFLLTLRQLYYQFVARGHITNTVQSYKRLGGIINDARLAGMIDWDAIEDRTRNLKSMAHWKDPGEIISAARSSFRLDKWSEQEFRPEVWIEKEALVGVIEPICHKLDVSYFACRGYVSQSEMYSAAKRMINRGDQTTVVIHLGDHDPSGIDMSRDMEDRLAMFIGDESEFEFLRIALNIDQIKKFNPPPNPAKTTDSRFDGYIKKFGKESWELDAIDPVKLQMLISSTVLKYRNDEVYNEVIEQEERYIRILENIENKWETLG